MKTPALLALPLVMVCSAGRSYGQNELDQGRPEWGRIPQEHLEMEQYPPDSSASVVFLADYGHVVFRGRRDMVFERHTRIKILTEAGYDWATVTIPYLAEDRTQRVGDIEGRTYYLAQGGSVETQEMNSRSVFDEDVDGEWRQMRFTLPALQPGAVIEYRYEIVSTSPVYFPDWEFQRSEPVLWSEFRAEIPEIYHYVSVFQGNPPDITEQEPYARSMTWLLDPSEDLTASAVVGGVRHRWVVRDAPALRWEPYMTTPEDFRTKLRFQLAAIGPPSVPTVELRSRGRTASIPATQLHEVRVLSTWEQLAEELMDLRSFGEQIGRHRSVRDRAAAIAGGLADPARKMQALYDYLRTTMVWTGERGVLVEQDLDDALAAQSANSPEIALLLVSMLREVGLDAHPVLISTRSNGKIVALYPLMSQFNNVLTYVEIDGVAYLLDATDPFRPYTVLPEEALNGTGFLVRHPDPLWIPITPAEDYRHECFLYGAIDTAGQLTGRVESSDGGYSALENRRALNEAETPAAFVREILLDGVDGAVVDSVTITNDELVAEPLRVTGTFSAPAYAQVAGEFVYFNPLPLGRLRENPLQRPERAFPVDLAYPIRQVYNVTIALPAGYAVHEAPQSVRGSLPDDGGMYQRLIQVEGDRLLAQSQLVLKQVVFEPEQYERIRAFFDYIVAREAEQVVLRRVSESEPETN